MLTYVNKFGRTMIATDVVIATISQVWVGLVLLFSFRYWCCPYPHLLWSKQWIQINGSQ